MKKTNRKHSVKTDFWRAVAAGVTIFALSSTPVFAEDQTETAAPTGVNAGPNSEGLNETEYERRAAEQGTQRDKPWRTLDLGESPSTISPNQTLGNQVVDAQTLTSSWERINQNADFTDLRNQVDDHERRLADAEVRVSNLEDQPGNWQEGAPEPDAFTATGQPGVSEWSPAIGSQTADFTQSRTITQDRQRTVNVYETNVVTGERRLVDTYTESDTQTTTETRLVDVANNPNGGTDGWSAWMNIGGVYSCTGYSPATSTRDQGVRFTQTRRCSQNQERFIYYLPEGDATTERRGTQVASVTQSRTATGTRVAGVWKFLRFPTASDGTPNTTTAPGTSCTRFNNLGDEAVYGDPNTSDPLSSSTGGIPVVVRCERP